MNPTCTIPSFSGTFGITHETIFFKGVREYFIFPARIALNPKMPKEPSSPSPPTHRLRHSALKMRQID
ncbi:MAG: hypothetical protein Q7V19_14810 [Bacteroidales bacterium]|nr:hypothetical protein [Bacteroidales bacterium]